MRIDRILHAAATVALVLGTASGAQAFAADAPRSQWLKPVAEEGTLVSHGITYAPGNVRFSGDMYFPSNWNTAGAKFPAVLVVHGGAWVGGSCLDPGEVAVSRALAAQGYVVFNINYRLIRDGGTYPKPVQDVRDALAFLVTKSAELKIDPSRIGLYGASAGATLAMLAAYMPLDPQTPAAPHYPKVSLPRPKAMVAFSPMSDFRRMEIPFVFNFLDDTPWHNPQLFEQASPITHVKSAIPTMCVHGEKDVTVPVEQSQQLVEQLKAAGIKAELVILPKTRHIWNEEPGPRRDLAVGKLVEFFDSTLK